MKTHCRNGHEYTPENTVHRSDGYYRCKTCQSENRRKSYAGNPKKYVERSQKYRKENPARVAKTDRKGRLKRLYNISLEDYDQILESQEGRCAICRRKPRKYLLAVDHDHKTGVVRGLLCKMCNHRGLGAFKDSYEVVQRAADYLAPTQALFGPPTEILKYVEEIR